MWQAEGPWGLGQGSWPHSTHPWDISGRGSACRGTAGTAPWVPLSVAPRMRWWPSPCEHSAGSPLATLPELRLKLTSCRKASLIPPPPYQAEAPSPDSQGLLSSPVAWQSNSGGEMHRLHGACLPVCSGSLRGQGVGSSCVNALATRQVGENMKGEPRGPDWELPKEPWPLLGPSPGEDKHRSCPGQQRACLPCGQKSHGVSWLHRKWAPCCLSKSRFHKRASGTLQPTELFRHFRGHLGSPAAPVHRESSRRAGHGPGLRRAGGRRPLRDSASPPPPIPAGAHPWPGLSRVLGCTDYGDRAPTAQGSITLPLPHFSLTKTEEAGGLNLLCNFSETLIQPRQERNPVASGEASPEVCGGAWGPQGPRAEVERSGRVGDPPGCAPG